MKSQAGAKAGRAPPANVTEIRGIIDDLKTTSAQARVVIEATKATLADQSQTPKSKVIRTGGDHLKSRKSSWSLTSTAAGTRRPLDTTHHDRVRCRGTDAFTRPLPFDVSKFHPYQRTSQSRFIIAILEHTIDVWQTEMQREHVHITAEYTLSILRWAPSREPIRGGELRDAFTAIYHESGSLFDHTSQNCAYLSKKASIFEGVRQAYTHFFGLDYDLPTIEHFLIKTGD